MRGRGGMNLHEIPRLKANSMIFACCSEFDRNSPICRSALLALRKFFILLDQIDSHRPRREINLFKAFTNISVVRSEFKMNSLGSHTNEKTHALLDLFLEILTQKDPA